MSPKGKERDTRWSEETEQPKKNKNGKKISEHAIRSDVAKEALNSVRDPNSAGNEGEDREKMISIGTHAWAHYPIRSKKQGCAVEARCLGTGEMIFVQCHLEYKQAKMGNIYAYELYAPARIFGEGEVAIVRLRHNNSDVRIALFRGATFEEDVHSSNTTAAQRFPLRKSRQATLEVEEESGDTAEKTYHGRKGGLKVLDRDSPAQNADSRQVQGQHGRKGDILDADQRQFCKVEQTGRVENGCHRRETLEPFQLQRVELRQGQEEGEEELLDGELIEVEEVEEEGAKNRSRQSAQHSEQLQGDGGRADTGEVEVFAMWEEV
ncbi:hypothetical protein B0H16DRAFT_1480050 [Mycena metata]|uniref:Uncharacterized protein n=1 Tax=Mycena metata TaxID=1033252 RepID=A0AAD7MD54_9AGAR|nr:hypothetical protein B0H16DRAFT_1480050 [Mycena metata]